VLLGRTKGREGGRKGGKKEREEEREEESLNMHQSLVWEQRADCFDAVNDAGNGEQNFQYMPTIVSVKFPMFL
jgi:hypothetical protein